VSSHDLSHLVRMAVRTTVFAAFLDGVHSHGYMNLPVPRQPGAPGLDLEDSGHCAQCWFTNGISIPGKATICDAALLTTGLAAKPDVVCTSGDNHQDMPWRAPGTAPSKSPCGIYGTDGVNLPPTTRSIWQRGSVVEVAERISANHGGGYAYRLCPSSEAATEACFQAHHLAFEGNTTTVYYPDGTSFEIPAIRVSTGTYPEGSQWTRNPIPKRETFFPAPFVGGSGDKWGFSLVDRVVLPEELATGDYVLSWRWDCEGTNQVWANCADVTIVSSMPPPSPTPIPVTTPEPTPVPTPVPVPTPPAPTPLVIPTCCWSKWGDVTSCGGCPNSGGHCNTDWSLSCSSNSDCSMQHVIV